ncbi:MAG: hypothetical protein Q4D70_08045, partial [bacterium]|nr:hypothetical protein [bacterium]
MKSGTPLRGFCSAASFRTDLLNETDAWPAKAASSAFSVGAVTVTVDSAGVGSCVNVVWPSV